jgi:hypothetical protein
MVEDFMLLILMLISCTMIFIVYQNTSNAYFLVTTKTLPSSFQEGVEVKKVQRVLI